MGSIKSRFIIILFCIALSLSCVSASAGAEKPGGEPPVESSGKTEAVTGAYTRIDISSVRAIIALTVLKEHLNTDGVTLKGPFEFWQQVVAGYKIRINCFYTKNGVKGVLTGVVYISPDGETKVLDVQMSK